MSDVTVLGAGLMGSAIARALLAQGLGVCVWNRTAAKTEPLIAEGAAGAESAAAAVAASPLTILMVSDYAAVDRVLDGLPDAGFPAGSVVLNLTTGTPEQVAASRPEFERRGLTYLDGAVSGHPQDIATPASQIVLGGDEAAWRTHRTMIERLAGQTLYLGADPAVASALDLALVGCFQTVTLCAFVEAAAYASSHGLDVATLPPLAARLLTKMQGQVAVLAEAIATGSYATDQATIAVYVAALEQIRSSMLPSGLPARLTTAAWENAAPAVAAGQGDLGLGVQYEYLRSQVREAQSWGTSE
jgi:3-hydroxyisobutyrate dehydrogenase-like beta-hydroxyacid dehydrogenase